jgi:hypothetical protein
LGTFDVTAPTSVSGEDDQEDFKGSIASIPFPTGIDPTDVAAVQISDSTGAVILSGNGEERGGDIIGTEHLEQAAALIPTTAAPAGTKGFANIEADDDHGLSTGALNIQTSGLADGTYTVSVTSLATGSSTVLGTLSLPLPTGEDNEKFGDGSALPFPAGFNPLDIASVQVSDSTGTVLLAGDFSTPAGGASSFITAKVSVTPGAAAPAVRGTSTLATRVSRRVVRQQFRLTATGAPANTVLTMKVNGVSGGKVKTNRKGAISIKKLPKGVAAHKVTSVTLQNAQGNNVLSVRY